MRITMKWMAPVAATALAGGTLLLGPAAAGAEGATCAEDLGDTAVEGGLVVPAGETCTLGGATISGGIVVEAGGWLDATSIEVGGNVEAIDPYGVSIDGSKVAGDVSVYGSDRGGFAYLTDLDVAGSVAAGGVDVEVTDSSIERGLLTQDAHYVQVLRTSITGDARLTGSPYGSVVSGAIVRGTLTVEGSQRETLIGATADGEPEAWGNEIDGDLVVSGNSGNTRVAATNVTGTMSASGNDAVAVFGQGNTAGAVEGEFEGEQPGEPGSGDQSIAVTVPEQAPGELVWSLDGTSSLVDLGVAESLDDRFAASGEIVPIRVLDTRVGSPAWSLTAQVSDFQAGEETISSSYLGWTPEVRENEGGAVAGAAIESGFSGGDGLSVARTLVQANEGHDRGESVTGAKLDLQLPLDTPLGTYSATVTLTALS